MAKFYNTFEFIGNVQTAKEASAISKETTSTSGWTTLKVVMGIKEGGTNSAFLDISSTRKADGKGIVYTVNKLGEKMQIPFADRLNPQNLDLVADYAKLVVDLETDEDVKAKYTKLQFQISNIFKDIKDNTATDEDKAKCKEYMEEYKKLAVNRHEFVSDYDFVKFIEDNLVKLKDLRVKVRGNYEPSYSGGKSYVSYSPKSIEIAKESEGNKLECHLDFYFDKESVSVEDDMLIARGYVLGRDGYTKADRYFPTNLISKDTALFDNYKLFFTTKEKTYQHLAWVCNVYNGANQKEFTYDDLTDQQKAMVSMGMSTIDEYRLKGGYVLGNNVSEIRMVKPLMEKDFANGMVDTLIGFDEFSTLIAKGVKEVVTTAETNKAIEDQFGARATVEDVPFTPDVPTTTEEQNKAVEDLFGGLLG